MAFPPKMRNNAKEEIENLDLSNEDETPRVDVYNDNFSVDNTEELMMFKDTNIEIGQQRRGPINGRKFTAPLDSYPDFNQVEQSRRSNGGNDEIEMIAMMGKQRGASFTR
jgi:hypothetical protein